MVFLRRHIVLVFFGLTYLISWGSWIWVDSTRQDLIGLGVLVVLLGFFGPCLSGFVCTGIVEGREGVKELLRRIVAWRVSGKAYLFAIFVPFLFSFLPLVLFSLMGGSPPRLDNLFRIVELLPIFIVTLFIGGLSEEPGWRGFALPILRKRHGRVSASLIVGIFWGAWHIPLHTVGTAIPVASLIGFIILTTIISILFTALADLSQDSVLLAIVFHATYNTFISNLTGLLEVPPAAQHQMLAVLLVVALVFCVLWWWRRVPRPN